MIQGLYKCFDHWHQNGTLFIYSDPHFDDAELVAGVANYPSAEEQVKMINAKVGKKDTIVFLGDINNVEWIKKIRGYKVLIMGNHDTGRTNYERITYHEIFEADMDKKSVRDAMARLYPNCKYFIEEGRGFHAPFEWWDAYADNQLFDEVYEGPVMISEKLILSHEPVNIPWAFNIHGHIHDTRHKNDKYHFNVCANIINYTPINFNQWMKEGHLAPIESLHRGTIDYATNRAKKRGYKLTKYE